MRRSRLCAVFAASITLSSLMCAGLGRIDVTQTASTTVPKATPLQAVLGDTLSFAGFDKMDFAQSESLKNQGISKNQISSVRLKSFTLAVTSPPGQDFSFINELKFYVAADGQPKRLIASGSQFGAQSRIGLDLADVELVPYVTAAAMDVTSEVSGNAPAQDTAITATLVFDTQINVQGALCGK